MTYFRYSDDIDTPETDEQATIDGIIQGMGQHRRDSRMTMR